jgi:hypothetical protein
LALSRTLAGSNCFTNLGLNLRSSLADTLTYTPMDVKRATMDTLCLLLIQLREDYIHWIPTVRLS